MRLSLHNIYSHAQYGLAGCSVFGRGVVRNAHSFYARLRLRVKRFLGSAPQEPADVHLPELAAVLAGARLDASVLAEQAVAPVCELRARDAGLGAHAAASAAAVRATAHPFRMVDQHGDARRAALVDRQRRRPLRLRRRAS